MVVLLQARRGEGRGSRSWSSLAALMAAAHMSTELRQSIADSRAQYFSAWHQVTPFFSFDFKHRQTSLTCLPQETADTETESDASDSAAGERKPSYVGLSHSVNGYTAYSHYNPRAKKISPPLQIPVSPPRTLDRWIENIGRKYLLKV